MEECGGRQRKTVGWYAVEEYGAAAAVAAGVGTGWHAGEDYCLVGAVRKINGQLQKRGFGALWKIIGLRLLFGHTTDGIYSCVGLSIAW